MYTLTVDLTCPDTESYTLPRSPLSPWDSLLLLVTLVTAILPLV